MLVKFESTRFINTDNVSFISIYNYGFEFTLMMDENVITINSFDCISKEELALLFENNENFLKVIVDKNKNVVYINIKAVTRVEVEETQLSFNFVNDNNPFFVFDSSADKIIKEFNERLEELKSKNYVDHF